MNTYRQFLENKIEIKIRTGLEVEDSELNKKAVKNALLKSI